MTATKMTTTTAPTATPRRRVRVAGLVAASAAAVTTSLTLVPQAHAAEHTTPGHVAEATHSPTAFTPGSQALGKAPAAAPTGSEDTEDTKDDKSAEETGNGAESAEPAADTASDASEVTGQGRGARYDEGRLVPIPHDEQPDPEPASAEDIKRWINEALEVMDEHNIPGTHEGIHRNLMRESSGDPQTINMWDTNAHKNIPSKGLLQVIDPTFDQYHVPGTSDNVFDPVANIAAACNYAADRYGSMDNVDSAY
ncbi:transglycosylase SLT domain-containing protein [Streptomyces sp. NBC_01803]|uniref:transglycosylase SLT domain-containing protein n=1 Tax=Streptomyces sp. NBC_01803 TaxID=2975946 RepID=UPI002DDBD4D1|nr:transglycosylase SLT domain-containing protein [Streptomyces sp. NBC_01803]WSA42824.1 transglycosylase SLT domain-containing protein [Streptomyces sp. NBC_01803]